MQLYPCVLSATKSYPGTIYVRDVTGHSVEIIAETPRWDTCH